MADPRLYSIEQRKNLRANLSPLMQAMANNPRGEKINFCPFGCQDEQIDEHGYCKHLIGFTVPGTDDKDYEPMVRSKGRRVIRLKTAPGDEMDEDGVPNQVRVPEKVQPGDKLVRITVSSRVYRDVKPLSPAKAK